MALRLLNHIELPAHRSKGGFDHADVHPPTDRLYVAHTSNDFIDIIDYARDRYIESMPGLRPSQARLSLKRAASFSRAIEARTPSRYSRLVPSGTPSRSQSVPSRMGSHSTPLAALLSLRTSATRRFRICVRYRSWTSGDGNGSPKSRLQTAPAWNNRRSSVCDVFRATSAHLRLEDGGYRLP